MRRHFDWVSAPVGLWLAFGLAGVSLGAAPVRIMPLGDSITYGVGDETNHGGY